MKDERIYIEDEKLKRFPAFIRRLFAKNYYQQGIIQMDSGTNELTVCGDSVKWLDELQVKTTSQKRADKLMFEFLNKKYPEYKPYIQLF